MSPFKKLILSFIIALGIVLAVDIRAYAADKECEINRFNICLHSNNATLCALKAVSECAENNFLYVVDSTRYDCNALAQKSFFWTDWDADVWRWSHCCQKYKTEICYIGDGNKSNLQKNASAATLEYCAKDAQNKCEKNDPLSTRPASFPSKELLETLVVIIGLILFIWFLIFISNKGKELEEQRVDRILKKEIFSSGLPLTPNDIRYHCIAKYYGGYTKHPEKFTAHVFILGKALYIQHRLFPDALYFRIDLKSVKNIGLFTPSLPYIMNLNLAGILANEAMRKEIGNGVFIEFLDDIGLLQTIALGEFEKIRAETFVSGLHNCLEKEVNGI